MSGTERSSRILDSFDVDEAVSLGPSPSLNANPSEPLTVQKPAGEDGTSPTSLGMRKSYKHSAECAEDFGSTSDPIIMATVKQVMSEEIMKEFNLVMERVAREVKEDAHKIKRAVQTLEMKILENVKSTMESRMELFLEEVKEEVKSAVYAMETFSKEVQEEVKFAIYATQAELLQELTTYNGSMDPISNEGRDSL